MAVDWLSECDDFIETICEATFVHEKRALFQSVMDVVNRDSFADAYLMPFYRCDDRDKLLDWFASTAADPVATLIKYLLHDGFYYSNDCNLREFILQSLEALSEYALSKSLCAVSVSEKKWAA